MSQAVTAPIVRGMKGSGNKVVCLTAYDAIFGRLADESGVDIILVGDSVGNTVLGYTNMLPVSLEAMVHHTAAVSRGVQRALLVADMPFGSYQSSIAQAVDSAVALVKAGASAVKLEGEYLDAISAITKAGIPVMGHVGMTPQSVHQFGGFKVQGKGDAAARAVLDAALVVNDAGVFAMVLELIPGDLATEITSAVKCPTIGIGAGPTCDGEVQVLYDVLGFSDRVFKHTKPYIDGKGTVLGALKQYVVEVREGEFPTSANHS